MFVLDCRHTFFSKSDLQKTLFWTKGKEKRTRFMWTSSERTCPDILRAINRNFLLSFVVTFLIFLFLLSFWTEKRFFSFNTVSEMVFFQKFSCLITATHFEVHFLCTIWVQLTICHCKRTINHKTGVCKHHQIFFKSDKYSKATPKLNAEFVKTNRKILYF